MPGLIATLCGSAGPETTYLEEGEGQSQQEDTDWTQTFQGFPLTFQNI